MNFSVQETHFLLNDFNQLYKMFQPKKQPVDFSPKSTQRELPTRSIPHSPAQALAGRGEREIEASLDPFPLNVSAKTL